MGVKRENIFIIQYTDDKRCHIDKYTKNLFASYVAYRRDTDMTYDKFRYIMKKEQYHRLNGVVKIWKHDFNEYLQPFFTRILECNNLCDKKTELSKYTKDKVWKRVRKLYEDGGDALVNFNFNEFNKV